MTQKEINRQRKEVLAAMEAQFNDALVPARLVDAVYEDGNEDGICDKPDILNVLMEDLAIEGRPVLAEFFFAPSAEEDEVVLFNSVLTLEGEVPDKAFSEVLLAANYLNAMLPVGAFMYDTAQKKIAFRHSYEMDMGMTDDKLRDTVDLTMGVSIETVQRFGSIMTEVAAGERDAASILSLWQ